MPSRFTIDRELVIRIFFFVAFFFLLTQVFLLAKPFLPSVLVAGILAMMFAPAHRRVLKRVRKPDLAALIMTAAVVLAGLLPLITTVWIVVRESNNLIPAVQNVLFQLHDGNLAEYRDKVPDSISAATDRFVTFFSGLNIDVKAFVLDNARELGARISSIGAFIARNLFITFFRLLILVLSLFFMFRDGERLFNWILGLIPMETEHKQTVAHSAYETFWAVTIGVFLTATAQAVTALVGFIIAGVRMPVLLAIAVGVVSLLGASFVVCLPVALFMMLESFPKGMFLLIWGVVLVGWLDNLLKPLLIGSRARMPFVLVFFSILGGLRMYGMAGIILGPVLVACVLAFVRIYKETYGS